MIFERKGFEIINLVIDYLVFIIFFIEKCIILLKEF